MKRMTTVAVWLFACSIPMENSVGIENVVSLSRITGVICFALALEVISRMQNRNALPRVFTLFAAFIIYCMISLVWTVSLPDTWYRIGVYLQLFAMMWMLWQLRKDMPHWRLLQAYVVGCSISAGWTIVNYFHGISREHESWDTKRYAAPGFDENDMALTLSIGIPIAVYLATAAAAKLRSQWLYICYLPLAGIAILLTASRGGFLAMITAVLATVFLSLRASVAARMGIVIITIISSVAALNVAPSKSLGRLQSIPQQLAQGNLAHRRVVWQLGIEQWKNHPIIGVGAGAFRIAVSESYGEAIVAHSIYVGMLVDGGIVGAGIFGAILIASLGSLRRLPLQGRTLWITVLLTWGVGVASLSWDYRKITWLIIGLIACHVDEVKNLRKAAFAKQGPLLNYLAGGMIRDGRPAKLLHASRGASR